MSHYKCSLLVVDDEPYILSTLAGLLGTEFEVLTADSAVAAQAIFSAREIDLILTDQKMPCMSGVQLLEWVRRHHPRTRRSCRPRSPNRGPVRLPPSASPRPVPPR